jgi:hypothetical protein
MPQSRRPPLHLLLAEAFRLQVGGNGVYRGLEIQAVVFA